MRIDVLPLPQMLQPHHLSRRAIVVIDVLRATTSMVAALASGAREIRVFGTIDEARAVAEMDQGCLLAGEVNALRPAGFELGNSPADFTVERCGGRTLLMSTTNGTRAILAARSATTMYAAALVNARATAEALARQGRDVTLLCSGTNGAVAVEDHIGAGAIIAELERIRPAELVSDEARVARGLFETHRSALPIILRQTSGGRNVIAAGLEGDVDFASRVNEFNIVATVDGCTLSVKRAAIV